MAMGSPLCPVLANLFMSHHERYWIKEYTSSQILFYKKYVDDIFCLVENESVAQEFLVYLNSKHPNINLTMEPEIDSKLPFLDILITSSPNGNFITSSENYLYWFLNKMLQVLRQCVIRLA